MPFGRSKTTHRTPLQRLNDSRRSLALAGLAAGATVAAIFRRKKGRGEAEFDAPIPTSTAPEPATPAAPVDSGPPAAIDIPPAAGEPAVAEPSAAPEPAAADEPATPDEPSAPAEPADRSSASEAPAKASSSSIVEPATGELSAEEASILAVLAQSGRIDDDRTALAVATSLERETTDVAAVLRKLGAEGVVSGELYTASGDKIWAVTERGVRRLGAQH